MGLIMTHAERDALLAEAQQLLRDGYNDHLSRAIAEARDALAAAADLTRAIADVRTVDQGAVRQTLAELQRANWARSWKRVRAARAALAERLGFPVPGPADLQSDAAGPDRTKHGGPADQRGQEERRDGCRDESDHWTPPKDDVLKEIEAFLALPSWPTLTVSVTYAQRLVRAALGRTGALLLEALE